MPGISMEQMLGHIHWHKVTIDEAHIEHEGCDLCAAIRAALLERDELRAENERLRDMNWGKLLEALDSMRQQLDKAEAELDRVRPLLEAVEKDLKQKRWGFGTDSYYAALAWKEAKEKK